jgi:hypothetical protein
MAISNYLSAAVLNATLTNTSYTSPATVYVALYSVAPTPSTGGTELTGSSYARVALTSSVTANVATSTANVVFGPASATWSTAVSWAVCDAASAGNILYFNALLPNQTVQNSNTLNFQTGNITINLS